MRDVTFMDLERTVTNLKRISAMVDDDGRTALASNDHLAIIRHFDQLRRVNAIIKDAKKALDAIEQSFSREHVPEALREQGVKSVTIDGIGRVTISHRWSASMIDKEKGMDWLRSNGHGGIIQETVNSSTLSAFAKDLFQEQDTELPPELFKVGQMAVTSITKAG